MIAEKLEEVERGEIDRLMIFMPPRHGKSELATKRFPAYALGRNPRRQIIQASYNSDLATDFGRQVRNIVSEQRYRNVFGTELAADSKAANRWNTSDGGAYVAAGVGTAVTGRGADIFIIDDPLKDREEAESESRRETIWNWYTSTAYTRLMKGGAVILIQCMTGDTPVLMASGKEKPLKDVRPGDVIATYEKGKITTSTVRNWANQGSDRIYTIRMKSGTVVRANARHPFLVYEHGEETWQRTASLKKGSVILKATGVNGKTLPALQTDVTRQQSARECVPRTTTSTGGKQAFVHHQSTLSLAAKRIFGTAMELISRSMIACLPNRMEFAPSVTSLPRKATRAPIGTTSSASITATIAKRFAGFSATTATLRSDTERQKPCCSLPLNTFAVIHDEVEEVTESGFEDVYDIQVDRTENFIANGLVSHNTRWHEDDLAGRLLEAEAKGGDKWEKLILPAVMDDGEALWPEMFDEAALARIKSAIGPRDWSALYQQSPSPDDGTYFQRAWFDRRHEAGPKQMHVYITSDYAVTENGGDWTEHMVWGLNGEDLFQLDGWSGQTSSDVWIDSLLDLIAKWKPLCAFGEGGVIEKAVRPMLKRRMVERRIHCRMEWIASVRDKASRARGFQSRAAMGRVSLLAGDKGEDLLNQLLVFPAGKHDDKVDVCSLMGLVIDEAHPAIVIERPKAPPRDGWGRWDDDREAADWKAV